MPIRNSKIFKKIYQTLDKIHLPVLDLSLWQLLKVYIGGIFRSKIIQQGESISWNFFISLFPFILFLLSILPYLPHYDEVYNYIFGILLPRILPSHLETEIIAYIESVIIPKIEGLSKFTIILVLFFATNGTYALIKGFNENTDTKRGLIKEYALAFVITLAFIIAIVLSILGIYYAEVVLKILMPDYESNWVARNLTKIISYFSFPLFYCIALSLLYWAGTVKVHNLSYAVTGAVFTTTLFMITTYGFAFYVKNFATYNFLYGSIGSLILLMIWVNVNVILILLGNELNLVIENIHTENKKASTEKTIETDID